MIQNVVDGILMRSKLGWQRLTSGIQSLQGRSTLWVWVIAICLSGFLAYYLDAGTSRPSGEIAVAQDPTAASTLIPVGFVLVPIEVANFESLDSILGQFGVVDLFSTPESPGHRAAKVASQIKILRAPLNPSHFAVLVRDSESANLVEHPGPFTVIVQNPKKAGTGFVMTSASTEKNTVGEGRDRPLRHDRSSRITVETLNEKNL